MYRIELLDMKQHQSVYSFMTSNDIFKISLLKMCIIIVFLAPPQRASPGCFTAELSTCWRSSPLTGTPSLWPVRWWEPTCCPFSPETSCTSSRSACDGSVTATAHIHRVTEFYYHQTAISFKNLFHCKICYMKMYFSHINNIFINITYFV